MPQVIGLKDSGGQMQYLHEVRQVAAVRPDFTVLVYPAYLLNEKTGALAEELPVTREDISAANRSFGILYGVSSFGSRDSHLDVGAGFGYTGGNITAKPALMLGGATRVSRRVSLLTENYVITSLDNQGLVSYGARFFGEKLSVDLAFFNAVGSGSTLLFPGIPFVAFAVKF